MEKQKIIRFGSKDSRLGDHSYSGYWTGYFVCDGESHYEVSVPSGVFAGEHQTRCRQTGSCDQTSCASGTEVAIADDLPDVAQAVLGILVEVPARHLLVETGSYHMTQWGDFSTYHVTRGGEVVTPKRLRRGTLLPPGESVRVVETRNTSSRKWDVTLIVRNAGGEPAVEDGEVEARRQFARDQLAWLRSIGFSEGRARRVMTEAGPGQVRAAVEWAHYALATVESVDALDCLLCGAGGTHGFGWDRMRDALLSFGLEPPKVGSSRTFFGTLRGAKEALLAGLPAVSQ